jgi:PAS domain S-box-containing protein
MTSRRRIDCSTAAGGAPRGTDTGGETTPAIGPRCATIASVAPSDQRSASASAAPTPGDADRDANETVRFALEATRMGIWSWDAASDRVVWDDQACGAFGVPPEQAPTSYEQYRLLIHTDDRDQVEASIAEAMRTGVYRDVEHRAVWPDGSVHWLLAKASIHFGPDRRPRRILGGVIDITERKLRDEQLRQAQKMEAVGQLTAGVAHNFNNLLMAILPNVELARHATPEAMPAILDDIEAATERGAELVRQLMTFSGARPAPREDRQPVGSTVRQAVDLCRGSFPPRLAVVLDDRIPASVSGNHGSLLQALLAVLLNARDAVAAVAEPEIKVVVESVGPADARAHLPGALASPATPAIRVVVEDNGPGVAEPMRARLFEPFFTTKPVGQGTGLGLATSYALLREVGGHIDFVARPGGGAAFRMWLPIDEAPRRVPAASPTPATGGAHGERVLVVDDEPLVRRVMTRLLSLEGYAVTTVDGGHPALAAYDRPGAFDVVLLDLSMPDLDGREVRAELLRRDPHARVVYVSGYGAGVPVDDEGVVSLTKPVRADALRATLRRALDRP